MNELSPYRHTCYQLPGAGANDPENDCPACQWAMDQALDRMDAVPEVEWLNKLETLEDTR